MKRVMRGAVFAAALCFAISAQYAAHRVREAKTRDIAEEAVRAALMVWTKDGAK